VILLGLVPTAPYATPCGTEDRDSIRQLVLDHDAMMLSHHGSLTVGADVWTAYLRLEVLEHFANVLFKVQRLGGAQPLPAAKVEELLEIRRRSGFGLPHDEAIFQQYYEAVGVR
jgi:L-fuculose-phosphate aldolase